jgi:hypothetical protein
MPSSGRSGAADEFAVGRDGLAISLAWTRLMLPRIATPPITVSIFFKNIVVIHFTSSEQDVRS